VGLLLLAAGGLFALLYLLVAVVRTIRRAERISFLDTLLVFLTTLVLLAALVANRTEDTPLPLVEAGAGTIALVMLALSVLIALAEWFRPQRLRQSRGVFGVGAALLVLISTLSVPFVSEYFALESPSAVSSTSVPSTAVASAPSATPSGQERALSIFNAVVQVVAEETGLEGESILARLDTGETISRLVADSGGDLEAVIDRITTIMSDQIRQAAREARMTQAQAALALSQMELIVRLGVNQRLDGERFDRLFGGVEATEEADATETEAPTRSVPTDAPTRTPSTTPTTLPTRTPTFTVTPAPTMTGTSPPTATPPLATCVLVMNYNVNLRAAPDFGASVRATIPYNSVATATGRTADSAWWFVSYEGQSGWVSADYVSVDATCSALPVQ
jgi:hypothetical protein